MDFDDELVIKYAMAARIDANLMRAIIYTESGGDPYAIRFEPSLGDPAMPQPTDKLGYHNPDYFARRNHITVETERVLQHSSIGLMQVLGVKVRELGFEENLLRLCDPEVAIAFGVKVLKGLNQRYGGEEESVIAAYNAGSAIKSSGGMFVNQKYVDKVYQHLRVLRKLQ